MNALAARFHLDLTVVWDGIQDPTASRVPHRHGPQPGAATIRFSRPGRTADDSIIIDCNTLATTRQIVVVTADRNLRLRAARRGANTIKPEHLAALMTDIPTEPVPGQHHLIGRHPRPRRHPMSGWAPPKKHGTTPPPNDDNSESTHMAKTPTPDTTSTATSGTEPQRALLTVANNDDDIWV